MYLFRISFYFLSCSVRLMCLHLYGPQSLPALSLEGTFLEKAQGCVRGQPSHEDALEPLQVKRVSCRALRPPLPQATSLKGRRSLGLFLPSRVQPGIPSGLGDGENLNHPVSDLCFVTEPTVPRDHAWQG